MAELPALTSALAAHPYGLPRAERDVLLNEGLQALTAHHYANCPAYRRIVDGAWAGRTTFARVEDAPYLPVGLFKSQTLRSVPEADIRVVLTSSGTTGQAVSRVFLDKETSVAQQRALANSLMHVLGPKRLPMLVIDTDAVFKDPRLMSARGAGVLGIMRYGRGHVFALAPDLTPRLDAVRRFLDDLAGQPFFMFGFTFMVWTSFYEAFREAGLDLSNGILLHSGGWKKLADRAVDNGTFCDRLGQAFGLTRIHNFYGMVEQIGTIFLEGPRRLLYPPNFCDVIVRDPVDWKPVEPGQPGVIQVVSLLPHSYPGHSVLTEDLGVVEAVDTGEDGWYGRGIRILGRVPRTELRGCSDVLGEAA